MAIKDQVVKSNFNMNDNRIKKVGTAIEDTDAINKKYVDELLALSSFQDDVVAVQRDATLVPNKTINPRSRYIIIDKTALHADFGSIVGLANNDIVEWDGSKFIVATDMSNFTSEYMLAYVEAEDAFYQYSASDDQWETASGLNEMAVGFGLAKINGELKIDETIVVRKKDFLIGDGSALDYVIVHDLNNNTPNVTCKETITNQEVNTFIEFTSANTITVSFNQPIGVNEIKVSIEG